MAYLYGGNILMVDLSRGKISKEPTSSYSGEYLGGRGINIKLLYDGVPPETDPLDPASMIIFGMGPLSGTPVPASRVEVTTKSPETGYLASSNFGGYFGPELKFAGYDNITITGKADKPVYLWIHNEQVEIRDASHLWGKDTYETQEVIRSEVNPEAMVACIGPAGENLVRFATIQHELGHGAGRTGTGAVMGSKNLKAIVVRGTKGVKIADPQKYLTIASELEQEMRNSPGVQEMHRHGMTTAQDQFAKQVYPDPDWEPKTSQLDLFLKYKPERTGCHGCPTQCMDLYPAEAKGGGAISCSLYAGGFYPVRNNDVDVILETGLLAQRSGVDIISSMMIVSWLMRIYEKGIITAKDTDGIPMEWGSREAIIGMFNKMIKREGFGDVIADGILPAAERIGKGSAYWAYNMKGLPQHSPKYRDALIALKGRALAMVMSSRGDTMRSMEGREIYPEMIPVIEEKYGKQAAIDYQEELKQRAKEITGTEKAAIAAGYEGKAELLVYSEDKITVGDCLSACKLMGSFSDNRPFNEKYQADLFSVGTGVSTSVEKLFEFAKRVRNLERAYCVREGMTRNTDSLPDGYLDHPVERGVLKGEVLESSKFEEMKSEYYALRGWDIATGIPTLETLENTGLKDIAKDLNKRGMLPGKSPDG